ncbi:MAG TPA: NosD domain-containing protein, partial [Gemmatimonadota bacterium]|nr:NosD domain-containing protein [Gemmatimonadota bacterium]
MTLVRIVAAGLATVAVGGAHPVFSQVPWRVSPGGPLETVGAALDSAAAGDTIRVGPGIYRERIVVERPVVLIGEGRPVLDGGGRGHVVEARAPLTIRGFVIRDSGSRPDREDAGILVQGATARIEGNRLEDVLYGVYLKDAPGSVVAGNEIRGKPLPLERRGDGIRLWYSHGSRVLGNTVRDTRDVVLYFSDRLVLQANTIVDGRYGLHTMYCHRGSFLDNRVQGNEVGAFLMYSDGLVLEGNVFADAAGASGMGLGLKDADDVHASGNLLVGNQVGIHLDNSPRSEGMA